jgi:hypothetical protein
VVFKWARNRGDTAMEKRINALEARVKALEKRVVP